eukprot:ANDGO_06583.mRNA.1 hypothetical protein
MHTEEPTLKGTAVSLDACATFYADGTINLAESFALQERVSKVLHAASKYLKNQKSCAQHMDQPATPAATATASFERKMPGAPGRKPFVSLKRNSSSIADTRRGSSSEKQGQSKECSGSGVRKHGRTAGNSAAAHFTQENIMQCKTFGELEELISAMQEEEFKLREHCMSMKNTMQRNSREIIEKAMAQYTQFVHTVLYELMDIAKKNAKASVGSFGGEAESQTGSYGVCQEQSSSDNRDGGGEDEIVSEVQCTKGSGNPELDEAEANGEVTMRCLLRMLQIDPTVVGYVEACDDLVNEFTA